MSLHDPITGDFPTRVLLDEEEEEAESLIDSYLKPPEPRWSGLETAFQKRNTLVLGVGQAASAVLTTCTTGAEEVCSLGDLHLHTASDPGVVLVLCHKPPPPEAAHALLQALLNLVSPQRMIILSSIGASEYRGHHDPSQEGLVYVLQTDAAARVHGSSSIPPLPYGTPVGGLAGAALTHAQVHGLDAQLLVAVQSTPLPDGMLLTALACTAQATLQGLEPGLSALLDTGKASMQSLVRSSGAALAVDARSTMFA